MLAKIRVNIHSCFEFFRVETLVSIWSYSEMRACAQLLNSFCFPNLDELLAGAIATLPPQVPTSYIAICDNILHRMRFPKFVAMVRDDLGEEVRHMHEPIQ